MLLLPSGCILLSFLQTSFYIFFLCSCSVGFREGAVSLPCVFLSVRSKQTDHRHCLYPLFLNHTLEVLAVIKRASCCTFLFDFLLYLLEYLTAKTFPYILQEKLTCNWNCMFLGRTKTQKPLQLVVGTLTPTSVFLSWGILVNPQHDWTATSNCASDR